MAAVYAPAFSTTTTKGQTFAVQVGNYLSRHRGGVLGQGASVMALLRGHSGCAPAGVGLGFSFLGIPVHASSRISPIPPAQGSARQSWLPGPIGRGPQAISQILKHLPGP